MKHLYLLSISMLVTLFSCSSEQQAEQTETSADTSNFHYHETAHKPEHPADSSSNPFNGKVFTAEAYKNDSLGWGYFISMDGKKTINQPHVPGVPGTKGFKTKEQALKTANFVIYKIEHNMLPPSVTPEELDSLGVLN